MKFVFITIYILTVLYIWIKMYFEINYVGDTKEYDFSLKDIIKNNVRFWAYVPLVNTVLVIWAEIEDYIELKNHE